MRKWNRLKNAKSWQTKPRTDFQIISFYFIFRQGLPLFFLHKITNTEVFHHLSLSQTHQEMQSIIPLFYLAQEFEEVKGINYQGANISRAILSPCLILKKRGGGGGGENTVFAS